MVLAIGLLVTFLGRSPRFPAAIVGGVGFGFFIDELGKFITSDNNYFFQPAAALIYGGRGCRRGGPDPRGCATVDTLTAI